MAPRANTWSLVIELFKSDALGIPAAISCRACRGGPVGANLILFNYYLKVRFFAKLNYLILRLNLLFGAYKLSAVLRFRRYLTN